MDLVHDANNNTSGEKCYSLRPRTALKKEDEDTDPEECWRPRGKSKRRPKLKPPPLSKYRRKTANARERSRMREINEAFETLRRVIPHLSTASDSQNEKLTKITTLRLAMKYITALNKVLQEPDLESDGESLLSDYTLTPPDLRDHSLTPTSLSDHSDHFDQFATVPVISENNAYQFPRYSVTAALTSPSSENLKPISVPKTLCQTLSIKIPYLCSKQSQTQTFTNQDTRLPNASRQTQNLSSIAETSVTCQQKSSKLSSFPDFNEYVFIHDSSLLDPEFRDHCLTPSDFQDHTLVSADFDGLDSSAVDFEDLFST